MSKTLRVHVLSWFVLVSLVMPVLAFAAAADEDGCAVCHKYSGLARLDQKRANFACFILIITCSTILFMGRFFAKIAI